MGGAGCVNVHVIVIWLVFTRPCNYFLHVIHVCSILQKNDEEGKIVVYTTSFKGVRHTYEECRYILTVFHNLRVRVEERDIYIHKFYQRELEERLGVEEAITLPVPQVYINGQHIGVSG